MDAGTEGQHPSVFCRALTPTVLLDISNISFNVGTRISKQMFSCKQWIQTGPVVCIKYFSVKARKWQLGSPRIPPHAHTHMGMGLCDLSRFSRDSKMVLVSESSHNLRQGTKEPDIFTHHASWLNPNENRAPNWFPLLTPKESIMTRSKWKWGSKSLAFVLYFETS